MHLSPLSPPPPPPPTPRTHRRTNEHCERERERNGNIGILHKRESRGYNLSPSNPKGEISFSNLPLPVAGDADAYVTRDAYVYR